MTIIEKENAILNLLSSQGAVISQIAQSLASAPNATVDLGGLQASIALLDTHVGQVKALIGSDSAEPVPTTEPAPATAPTPVPAPVPAPASAPDAPAA